jgi:hypothetical protein
VTAVARVVSAGAIDTGELADEIREWLAGIGGAPLVSIELWRVGDPHVVKTFPIVEGTDADELCSAICSKAQRDADAFKGDPQVYQFRAFFGKGAMHPQATFSASFAGAYFAPSTAGKSYPANYEGALALSMNHADESVRQLNGGHREIMSTTTQLLRDVREENKNLRAELREALGALRAIADENREAERDARKEAAEGERWDQFLGFARVLVPSAINRIAGAKILPEVTSPIVEQFNTFFDTLDTEQVEKITSMVRPEQAIALADVFTNFIERREKKRALATLVAKVEQTKKPALNGAAAAPMLGAGKV